MPGTIKGVCLSENKVEYTVDCPPRTFHMSPEEGVCDSYEEAMAVAKVKAAELAAAEEKKIYEKEKPDRSWASNVRYYRGRIKELKRDLEFAEKRLGIYREEAKKEKAAKK